MIQTLEVAQSDDVTQGLEDLLFVADGPTSVPHEAKDGGAASGSPGGASLMLQLVNHCRRLGYFVVVVLARPFSFEGGRKLEQADSLIDALEAVASLTVVVDQAKLTRASAELTMTQATAISDTTLEYTVHSIMWALNAPEWHGRDLRNFRRTLFPPMLNLLTCPGHGNLGRGQACIPSSSLKTAGLASALSTLAEDAVKAASESPFLDNSMNRATAVAALTVQELAGPQCKDIIVCPQARPGGSGEGSTADDLVHVECSLLVLESIAEAAGTTPSSDATSRDKNQPTRHASPLSRISRSNREPSVSLPSASQARRQAQPQAPPPQQQQQQQPQATPQAQGQGPTSSQARAQPPQRRTLLSSDPNSASASSEMANLRLATRKTNNWLRNAISKLAGGGDPASPAGGAEGGRQDTGQKPDGTDTGKRAKPAWPAAGQKPDGTDTGKGNTPAWPAAGQQGGRNAGFRLQSIISKSSGMASGGGMSQPSPAAMPERERQVQRMPDNLVSSMVAQSLDLPPGAARWRHEQRTPPPTPRPRIYQLPEVLTSLTDAVVPNTNSKEKEKKGKWPSWGTDKQDGDEGAEPPPPKPKNLRSRVAGMLETERDFK
eukprot:gene16544-22773_t